MNSPIQTVACAPGQVCLPLLPLFPVMPAIASHTADSVQIEDELSPATWTPASSLCDEWERRQDSEPAIFPSLLFTEEEVQAVNWDAVFAQW